MAISSGFIRTVLAAILFLTGCQTNPETSSDAFVRDLDAVPLPVSCEADDLGARVGAYTVYDDQNQDAMNALYKTRFGNLPSSNRRVSALRFISQENNTIIFISENLSSRYRAGAVRHELCHAACDLDPQVDCVGHFAPNGMEK